jgi:hypothetical protein
MTGFNGMSYTLNMVNHYLNSVEKIYRRINLIKICMTIFFGLYIHYNFSKFILVKFCMEIFQ